MSSAYWSKAVVPLHRFRFEPPLASEEPAGQYYERRYDDFRNAVTAARNVSTFGVDPDLIAMAQGHLQQDERELHLYQAVQDFASQQKLAKNTLPLNDNEQLAQAIFAQLTEEEFNRLPAEVQQMLTELVELLETKVDQLHEIEIMQARLSERYRGHSFALPELRDGT